MYGAHSGATAEGDNAVLMQKIVKDIMTDMQKEIYVHPKMTKCPKRGLPAQDSVSDLESLANLIYFREVAEIKNLARVMKQRVFKDGQAFYDVWMKEVMDLV